MRWSRRYRALIQVILPIFRPSCSSLSRDRAPPLRGAPRPRRGAPCGRRGRRGRPRCARRRAGSPVRSFSSQRLGVAREGHAGRRDAAPRRRRRRPRRRRASRPRTRRLARPSARAHASARARTCVQRHAQRREGGDRVELAAEQVGDRRLERDQRAGGPCRSARASGSRRSFSTSAARAHDGAALRAAERLVGAEAHEVGARGDARAHERLALRGRGRRGPPAGRRRGPRSPRRPARAPARPAPRARAAPRSPSGGSCPGGRAGWRPTPGSASRASA